MPVNEYAKIKYIPTIAGSANSNNNMNIPISVTQKNLANNKCTNLTEIEKMFGPAKLI